MKAAPRWRRLALQPYLMVLFLWAKRSAQREMWKASLGSTLVLAFSYSQGKKRCRQAFKHQHETFGPFKHCIGEITDLRQPLVTSEPVAVFRGRSPKVTFP